MRLRKGVLVCLLPAVGDRTEAQYSLFGVDLCPSPAVEGISGCSGLAGGGQDAKSLRNLNSSASLLNETSKWSAPAMLPHFPRTCLPPWSHGLYNTEVIRLWHRLHPVTSMSWHDDSQSFNSLQERHIFPPSVSPERYKGLQLCWGDYSPW